MQVIEKPKQMQSLSEALRREGKRIAFVPTMGYFHEGHLTLMREAKRLGDILVISIFVNPLQFGPSEDYERYPRDLERDLKMAEEVGVDIVFCPQVYDMYPSNFQTYVEVSELQKYLCGKFRPGHFRGVATVVLKLFNIVKPHVAVFGLKDYQQYLIIKRMVEDLNLDIEVVGVPTVREEDHLAASSRNVYLNAEERKAARALYKALMEAKRLFEEGERSASKILEASRRVIEQEPLVNLQYLELCNPETLEPLSGDIKRALLAVAAWVGKARLIDNIILE